MPNPDRHLLRISDTKITYITDILLCHIQCLRAEERYAAAASDTAFATISSGPESITTLTDVPLSDTPEEP